MLGGHNPRRTIEETQEHIVAIQAPSYAGVHFEKTPACSESVPRPFTSAVQMQDQIQKSLRRSFPGCLL